ncbi:hypothetical protein BLA29_007150 [Euroglyphus maynei]|uniref:Uncharacterized protein n=1 Tax=Euroglyphus maynei TaxID=6958 RepID=A0A1Y3APR8_EURMA|nr:hypothetical protein BLA29_007150 [Euroglyphus maynei]
MDSKSCSCLSTAISETISRGISADIDWRNRRTRQICIDCQRIDYAWSRRRRRRGKSARIISNGTSTKTASSNASVTTEGSSQCNARWRWRKRKRSESKRLSCS